MLTQKKPVATPKSVNWHWFFLFFFWFFLNFQIGIGFFWFFLVFLVFLSLVLARIRNWKLVFFGFFWFFFGFFWFFFGTGLGQHSKLETGFLGSVGFFCFFLGFFGFFGI